MTSILEKKNHFLQLWADSCVWPSVKIILLSVVPLGGVNCESFLFCSKEWFFIYKLWVTKLALRYCKPPVFADHWNFIKRPEILLSTVKCELSDIFNGRILFLGSYSNSLWNSRSENSARIYFRRFLCHIAGHGEEGLNSPPQLMW